MTEFYKELQEQACYCGFHYGFIQTDSTTGSQQSTSKHHSSNPVMFYMRFLATSP